jgi:hypothetical protein
VRPDIAPGLLAGDEYGKAEDGAFSRFACSSVAFGKK